MSYIALARKWRPRTFSQLVGQEPIINALTHSLNQQRLHHAYLFTGTRGVGKTSVARLLAKALNCEQGVSATACLQCEACLAIEQGRFIDLLEIDGASRTRVEDTRELLENVQYAPTNARFKVYLIDEVHMLSQHSFNALLKTLEEPPAHVKFLLATTDVQKLPLTVLSRCLQFNLRHLSQEIISEQLQFILKEEGFSFETPAVHILAKAARGSMRDGLSLLDQALAGTHDTLKVENVKETLGYTQHDYAKTLLEALALQNASALLENSRQIAEQGGHFVYVVEELLQYLHTLALHQQLPILTPLESRQTIDALAQQFQPEDVQLFYQIVLKGSQEMHLAPSLAMGFDMILLRMLTFRPAPHAQIPPLAFDAHNKPETPHSPVETTPSISIPPVAPIPPISPTKPPKCTTEAEPLESSETTTLPPVLNDIILKALEPQEKPPEVNNNQSEIAEEFHEWSHIIQKLSLSGMAQNALQQTELISKNAHECIIQASNGHKSLFTTAIQTRIESALSTYFKTKTKLIIQYGETTKATPAQVKSKIIQKNQKIAEESIKNDVIFQEIQKDFSAELLKNSIISLKDGI